MSLDWANKNGWVHGLIKSRKDAKNLIEFANAIMATLPEQEDSDDDESETP